MGYEAGTISTMSKLETPQTVLKEVPELNQCGKRLVDIR